MQWAGKFDSSWIVVVKSVETLLQGVPEKKETPRQLRIKTAINNRLT